MSRASGEGAVRGAAPVFLALGGAAGCAVLAGWALGAHTVLAASYGAFYLLFAVASGVRLVLPVFARSPPPPPNLPIELPLYTVIVPLLDEAAIAAQIVCNLASLNYPPDRVQVLLVLEAHDLSTRLALEAADPPRHMQILVAPPGGPHTKPRACNLALTRATGEIVVIYDAEDQPDRLQLLEAAARFSRAPRRLGCLQAPLRIVPRPLVLQRQFALEYASLFDVVLPALATLRLPFPLGGTSNHFRREALDDIGGWDAFNVTEDADIGFRLSRAGWGMAMLSAPTWEEAPEGLDVWMPQRRRWLKGYAQTWAVMMRRPFSGGLRQFVAVQATLGLSMVSSATHGPLALLTSASLLIAVLDLEAGPLMTMNAVLALYAWSSAVLLMAAGARRAGFAMTWSDAFRAIRYWPIQSLAATYALQQLVAAPFAWDKTPHAPKAAVMDLPPRRAVLDGRAVDAVATPA